MAGYVLSHIPQTVPEVETEYRKIKTKIPVPESISILNDLEKYESRSMHGQLPVVWDRAEGFQVYDKYGNCWIDFTSTIFVANAGHGNPHIVSALKAELNKPLLHTYTFANESRAKFLKKLAEITPEPLNKAFLVSSGTESTECAVKLTRLHGLNVNSEKLGIISFKGSMHGRTATAEILKGDAKSSRWVGYIDPNVHHLPFPYPWTANGDPDTYDWAEHFNKDISTLLSNGVKPENIAGFMIESYQGWGAIFYPKEYIQALCDFAKKHNILVTFDEIQGGFGRTGKFFVYQHYDVEPDMVCLGKGMSSSLPLAAVLGRPEILDIPEFGSMSSTHSGNPLCCAAGLANLEEIESKNLVEESARKGEILHSRLNEIKSKFSDRISYILGKGLLAGVIIKDPTSGEPDGFFASKVCEKAMQKGLLLVHTGRESIKIGPPLTISDDALLEGLSVLEECMCEVDSNG